MIDTVSAAEVLMAGGSTVRVIRPPAPDAVVLVTVPQRIERSDGPWIEGLMLRLASRLQCDPRQVIVVEAGTDLGVLDASALRALGLRRLDDD